MDQTLGIPDQSRRGDVRHAAGAIVPQQARRAIRESQVVAQVASTAYREESRRTALGRTPTPRASRATYHSRVGSKDAGRSGLRRENDGCGMGNLLATQRAVTHLAHEDAL